MSLSRTSRLQAKRKQTRRKLRRLMIINSLLLGVATVVIILYHHPFQEWLPVSQPAGGVEVKEPQPSEAVDSQVGTDDPVVNLTFVGDVMLSGHVETLVKKNGYDFPYHYVAHLFQQDDVTIANLETPVTHNGTPAMKEYVYKSPPEAIPAMSAAGIDLVNLANNHSLDQGIEGLLDTLSVLTQHNIEFVGAGPDAARAYAPVFVERNGISMAFLGFSRVVPEVSWYAGHNKPGVAASYDPEMAVKAIQQAKESADLVIVIAHWGKEKEEHPVDHQRELARTYIDAGADLVVGSHPHVLQGFERYKEKWIAYSLGNFIFTRSTSPITWETMVLQAQCNKNGNCQLKMLPHHAELGQAVPMDKTEGQRLIQRIEGISTQVRILPDGNVEPIPVVQ